MYTSGWQVSEELTRRMDEMIDQQTHRSFPVLGIDLSDPTGDDVKMTGVHVGPPTEPRGVRVKREAADEDDITVVPPPEAPVSEAEGSTEDDMSVDEHRNKDTEKDKKGTKKDEDSSDEDNNKELSNKSKKDKKGTKKDEDSSDEDNKEPSNKSKKHKKASDDDHVGSPVKMRTRAPPHDKAAEPTQKGKKKRYPCSA